MKNKHLCIAGGSTLIIFYDNLAVFFNHKISEISYSRITIWGTSSINIDFNAKLNKPVEISKVTIQSF